MVIKTRNNCNNKKLNKININYSKGLVILQWNAKGLRHHGEKLKRFVTDLNNKIYIVCIQETWINNITTKSEKTKLFPGFQGMFSNTTMFWGGLAFLFETVFHIHSFHLLWTTPMGVSIHGPNETINLYKFYVHPGTMNTGITLANYFKIISNSPYKLVLLEDFNCKDVIWGSSKPNIQGVVIDSLMDKL